MEMNKLESGEQSWYLVVLNHRPYAVLETETEVLSFLKKANTPLIRCQGKRYELPSLVIHVDVFGKETLIEKPEEYVPATRSWSLRE